MSGRLLYEEWNDLLARQFFVEQNRGRPVTFFIDDELLAKLRGTSIDDAVADLVSAVRSMTTGGDSPYDRIWHETNRWWKAGAVGAPPSLPLLAVAVLAATRMARTGRVAPNNYYVRFRELIGIGGRGEAPGYGQIIPDLWEWLHRWLEEKEAGRLGRSTIRRHHKWTNIGYALSQALFRESDRQRLTYFFEWFGLKPGERFDTAELFTYFRVWAQKYGRMTSGVLRMLDDPTYSEQLAEIVVTEAQQWDGATRDDAGRRRLPVHVLLHVFPRSRLEFIPRSRVGDPPSLRIDGPIGRIQLERINDEWYSTLELQVSAGILREGFSATSGGVTLEYVPETVIPFRQDEALGAWVSEPRVTPSEWHYVLVSSHLATSVGAFLGRFAQEGWTERDVPGLEGWKLFGVVVIEGPVEGSVDDALECLVPLVQFRPALLGGLLLPRGVYLSGGEPDVWVPPGLGVVRDVEVGGRRMHVEPDGGRLPLKELHLPPGTHEVRVGPTHLDFATIVSTGSVRPAGTGTLAHHLRTDGSVRPVKQDPADWDGVQPMPGEIRVTGALISTENHIFQRGPSPLILPAGCRDYRLVGARVGEIQALREPPKPPWMRRVRMQAQGFEYHPSIEVVWVLTLTSRGWGVRLRSRQEPQTFRVAGDEAVASWCECFLGTPPALAPADKELWDRYANVAREMKA